MQGCSVCKQVQMLYRSASVYFICLSQHINTVCLDVHKIHTTLHVNHHLYIIYIPCAECAFGSVIIYRGSSCYNEMLPRHQSRTPYSAGGFGNSCK